MPHKCGWEYSDGRICDKEIQDDWEQKFFDGFTIWFDSESPPKMRHRHNTPEFQSSIARGNPSKNANGKGSSGAAGALPDALAEVLQDPDNENAQERARILLVRELGAALQGGTATARLWEAAGQIVGQLIPKHRAPSHPDEPCQLCGRVVAHEVTISPHLAHAYTERAQFAAGAEALTVLRSLADLHLEASQRTQVQQAIRRLEAVLPSVTPDDPIQQSLHRDD